MLDSARRNRSVLLVTLWLIAAATWGVQAQSAPAFEVATIKPSTPNNPGHSMMMSEDKFETESQTVLRMIVFAYGLNMGSNEQVSGGPGWVGSMPFDVVAKEDLETVARLKKLSPDEQADQVRLMVRELLADRFKLKIHHELKELPVYTLTVTKSGVKMTPMTPDVSDPNAAGSGKKPRGSGIQMNGKGHLQGMNATAAVLATVLGHQSEIGGRMVLDKTGLTGNYDFKLIWTPDAGMSGAGEGGPASEGSGVSLFTAVQEQLGLKLEATKGSVDTIVIDSVAMPSEN